MRKNPALITAGIIFAIAALLHLYRLYSKFEITIAGYSVPQTASIIALIVAGGLSLWMFIASR